MLGTFLNRLRASNSVFRDGDSLLLRQRGFHFEIARERIRAARRSIPFCVVTIQLTGRKQLRQRRRTLIGLLHRRIRMTDQKADLGNNQFAVLLVDTPEMGGRSALDRLACLCEERQLDSKLSLRVHDPEGFDSNNEQNVSSGGGKRSYDESNSGSKWIRVDALATSEAVVMERPLAGRMIKRFVDIVGASVGLVLSSPLMVASAVAVKMTSPGPAFFKQTREGMRGKPFTIYKMRTMILDAEHKQSALREDNHRDGPAFKIKHDPRVTRIGSFLRKTCIDELPQFLNVIKGDMSLVGPRPLPWHESRSCKHWHRRRLDVPPGMTCYWQVDKSAAKTFDDWMRMDLRYVDRHGFWQDIRLIARTSLVPLTGRGSE